jgi:hypothetical protein
MTLIKRGYHGQSMRGTFHVGDLLTLVKAHIHDIRPGDIIVFERSGSSKTPGEIVHRVMRRSFNCLITQGDAVDHEDTVVVSANDIVGRVCYKEHNGRTSTVHGGWIGLCRGRWLHFYWRTRRQTMRVIQKPYAMLKASSIVPRLWKPEIFRVMINSEDGPCIQHVSKNRIVARFWPEQGRFECRKPWDLVIRKTEGHGSE